MVNSTPIIELPPTVQLGPRLEADIRRRIHESKRATPAL